VRHRMNRSLACMMCALPLAIGGGCQSDTEPIPGSPDDTDLYPRVTMTDRDVQEGVGVNEPIESRTDLGNLMVTLPIRARTSDDAHIDYRIIWLDAQGRSIRPEMSWRYKRLEPKQPERLTFTASSPEAVDYNIQIRYGRK